jgi:hypothetical protein
MWKTDIIYYGNDLAEYIDREFRERTVATQSAMLREATVEFWRDYVLACARSGGRDLILPLGPCAAH